VSILSPAADFVYGNTRLRARKADLLGPEDYDGLLGRDLPGIVEALSATAYSREIEAMLAGSNDLGRLHKALSANLGRVLDELRRFYQGPARTLVDLLLERYDLHNLIVLLRGRLRGHEPEQVVEDLVPLGTLGGEAAREVARQQDPAAAVDLLVSWRLPDAPTAGALARAWPEYERTQSLAALELALAVHRANLVERELAEAGVEAGPLRELIAREHDATNALVVLRLRSALDRGELAELPPPPAPGRFLVGGKIAVPELEAALRQPSRADAATRLAASARREDWRAPLERFAAAGDLPVLQSELEIARVRWAVGLFLVGDPLGLDIPVAFTVAKENEVRNLRLLGEEAGAATTAAAARPRLILPWGGARWGG
jgi:V/A-type H+/Na+-transporting ATPase subunit C